MFIKSLMIALSTYSIIPMPSFEWNEKNMKYAICFFPVVGILCATVLWLVVALGSLFNAGTFFVALIASVAPLVVTGGIHMDGFMDTVDALSSHASKEKKLEILSDPHCGAFAVIYFGIYMILNIGFLHEIYSLGSLLVICPVYVLSRSVSAMCAVNLPNAKKESMLLCYTKDAKRKIVNIVMIPAALVCAVIMAFISPICTLMAIIAGSLWTIIYCTSVKKFFGGVTGDTAGFFLQMFELCCIFGVWIGAII